MAEQTTQDQNQTQQTADTKESILFRVRDEIRSSKVKHIGIGAAIGGAVVGGGIFAWMKLRGGEKTTTEA